MSKKLTGTQTLAELPQINVIHETKENESPKKRKSGRSSTRRSFSSDSEDKTEKLSVAPSQVSAAIPLSATSASCFSATQSQETERSFKTDETWMSRILSTNERLQEYNKIINKKGSSRLMKLWKDDTSERTESLESALNLFKDTS